MKTAARGITAANLANYESEWSVRQYAETMRGLFPVEASLIDEFFPAPAASVLDMGCGAGRTTIELARRQYEVVGIDLSSSLIERARQQHPGIDFRLMDATVLQFPDRQFDAALFSYNGIDVIYPVEARVRCLCEAFRVLRPGGVFLFSSHNARGAIFSGGYFYVRGYLNAAKWIARQFPNRIWREGYWRYDDPGGPQHLYSASPSRTLEQIASVGFETLAVAGGSLRRDVGFVSRREQHVHFVVRRPV